MKILERLFGGQDGKAPELETGGVDADGARMHDNGPAEKAHSYTADQPISNPSEDRFGRWPFANRIAETLALRSDPSSVVVGIYGPWGDGKTSVLGLMETALGEHESVVSVRFNPWFFNSQESLLRGFFETLADALGKRLKSRGESAGELLKKYGGIISVASAGWIPGEGVKNLGEGLSTVELQTLRVRLEQVLREAGTRIVVMIDDIDRLDRDDIHAIFKLVKLSAGFEHISYVLAFDADVVAESLGSRYGSGDAEAGRSYLEKIVQVPLHLPPPDVVELRRLAFSGVDAALNDGHISLTDADTQKFVRYFIDGIEPRLRTPRQAKLFVNAVTFALPLLKGEANPVDQMLIEGIRVFYPGLYAVIRDNPDRFLKQGRESGVPARALVDTAIDDALAGLTISKREQVKNRLLEPLFPRFTDVGYGSEWESSWAREKRICSSEYFSRYFSYAIPAGDISDQVVEGFIELAAHATPQEITQFIEGVVARRAIAKLIRKLRDREDVMDPNLSPKVAQAILVNGPLYPRQQQMLMSDFEFIQAAALAVALIRRIPSGNERLATATQLMTVAEPLGLAAQLLRFIRHSDEKPEANRLLNEDEERQVGAVLAKRIESVARDEAIYRRFPQDANYLLWFWSHYGDVTDPKLHITSSLTSADEALVFLSIFLGTAWGMDSGLPSRSDFRREAYQSAARYVDPQQIMTLLREEIGPELDEPSYDHPDEAAPDVVLAHQFSFIHRAALEEGEGVANSASDSDGNGSSS